MNVKLLKICVVFCFLRDASGIEDEIETFVNINGKKALQYVGDKFLSFTIDPAVLLAGVSLSDNSLRLAKHLSPAFMRIAGPSTPFVKYFDKDDRLPTYLSEDGNSVVVSPSMWFGINEWLKLANLVPVFGLNDADTARGVWNPKATLPLLEISDKLNVSCYWQLGYDSSNKSETRYMQDLNILDYILAAFPERNETWKIVGSDISHISPEKTENTLDEVKDIITSVMWEPSVVKDDSFPANDEAVKLIQQTSKSNVKLWTTAPKSEGPVTFSSALLWAKQLGNAAKIGYDVVFRQPRIHELFSDTPAYWLSLFHKNLMGNNVLDAKAGTSHNGTNIYAHCTRKQNSFVRRGAVTVMIVNANGGQYKVKVKLGTAMPEKSMEVQSYLLTSPGLNSTAVLLNGHLLTPNDLRKPFPFEPKMRRTKTTSHILLTVPPNSIGFFVLPGTRAPVCVEGEKETELLLEEMEINQNSPLSEEILKLEARSSFGENRLLGELAQKMRQEMKSDQQYYSSVPVLTRIDRVENEAAAGKGKIDERGRRLFIDRVKLAERQRKHLDFQKKRDELKRFLLEKAKTAKLEPKMESKSKHIELTSAEAERILKDRAKQRAARRNIVFTDEELDALIQRASKKLYRKKTKRSVRPKQRRYINMQLLERTVHFDPISEKRSLNIENDNSENNPQRKLGRDLKRSTTKPEKNVGNNRFRRSLDVGSKLSEYKMKLAERRDDRRNTILGLTETMRENVKDKLQDLKNRRRFTRDLNAPSKLSQFKIKLAERSRKWDEKKDEILENAKAGREILREKLNELKSDKRFKRELNINSRIAQFEERLAESRKKWDEKKKKLLDNTETMKRNMEEKLEGIKLNRRITRDLKMDSKSSNYKKKSADRTKVTKENIKRKLKEMKNKMRFRRDINMDLLDTRGQKKSEKKSTINSKKLKDTEATIRQPGQTSSEFAEDSLELQNESIEEKPVKQEVYAELADSEDLEEEEFFHTTPRSKKISFFEKKSKVDPFAIAHPTIDIVEPMFMKPKKSKKKKSKSDDDLQFLRASEEFTDIEDDLPCIHEFFGPDASIENKKTTRMMQELGEIFEDEKAEFKKSKKKKAKSDEEFMRKKRYISENYEQFNTDGKLTTNQEATGNNKNSRINSEKQQEKHPSQISVHDGSYYDQSSPDTGAIEADEAAVDKINVQYNAQGSHSTEEDHKKRKGKKPALLDTLDIEENFKNYKKEMKKHLKDLKTMLDGDKLRFEEKKQKNKLKLLQLKKKEEMELADKANDKLIEIHKEENQHGNQLLEQLQNLKKELQLKKDQIDQALKRKQNEVNAVEHDKPKWNDLRMNLKRNMKELSNGLEQKLHSSSTIQENHQDLKLMTEPKVTVVKRSIFDTRRNILDTYQPMSLDLRMWKPSDVSTLQNNLNPLGIGNLSTPNDLHFFQNLLGQNNLLRKRRNVDPETLINAIDNDIDDDIDETFNEIKKDVDHLPDGMNTINEEDYKLGLPGKDEFEIVEKDGDTEMRFDHHDAMRGDPEAIFDTTDDPSSNFFGDDSVSESKADSEGGDDLGSKNDNATERTDEEESVIQKTIGDVSNIQKIANKEQAEIFENFISNFTGFISNMGKHIREYMKFVTKYN